MFPEFPALQRMKGEPFFVGILVEKNPKLPFDVEYSSWTILHHSKTQKLLYLKETHGNAPTMPLLCHVKLSWQRRIASTWTILLLGGTRFETTSHFTHPNSHKYQ